MEIIWVRDWTIRPGTAEPILFVQEQVRRGEKFLQPLAGWEAAELGPPGVRFLALRAQLIEFSRALAQRRQRLADAERLFQFFKQVGERSFSGFMFSWTENGCFSFTSA